MTATKPCTRCDGCGQIANSDDGEPWSVWMNLPLKSALAVTLGLVQPVTCPDCKGVGALPVVNRPEYVYVASSWRNNLQPGVIAALRAAGIDCYDFKSPEGGTGFHWSEVGVVSGDNSSTVPDYLRGLEHPRSIEGYNSDFEAMQRADTFVLVLPCGRSAHLELGWAVGAGKRTAILLEDPCTPELMYRMVDYLAPSLFDLLGWLGVED